MIKEAWFKRSWLIPTIIFVAVLIIKLIGVAINPIALDEPFTLFYANSDLNFLNEMMANENNPPTHFYLMHYWIKLFGHEVWVLRLPSVLAISASAAIVYQVTKERINISSGLIASSMFIISNYITVFSHEVRAYPFLILFTALSMLWMNRALTNSTNLNWILWGVFNALMLYFHFIAIVWWIAQFTLVLLLNRDKVTTVIKSNLISIIIAIPILIHLFYRFTAVNQNGTWINDTGSFDGVYNQIWKFSNSPVAAVVTILLIISGAFLMSKRGWLKAKTYLELVLLFVLPIVLIVLLSQIKPIFLDRYLVFVAIPFFILIAQAIDSFSYLYKHAVIVGGSVIIIIMLVNFKLAVDNQRNLPEIAMHVEEFNSQKKHITLVSPPWIDIRIGYHLDESAFWNRRIFSERMNEQGVFAIGDTSEMPSLQEVDGVLLIDGDMRLSDPNNTVRDILYKRYDVYRELKEYKGYTLLYFTNSH